MLTELVIPYCTHTHGHLLQMCVALCSGVVFCAIGPLYHSTQPPGDSALPTRVATHDKRVASFLEDPQDQSGHVNSQTVQISVHCVAIIETNPPTCSDVNVVYTATEDHITALTVGSCLRQTLNSRVMFVFTLMQSRTHVDTVHSVLDGLTDLRHIY